MDIKKIGQLDSITPSPQGKSSSLSGGVGPSFKDALDKLNKGAVPGVGTSLGSLQNPQLAKAVAGVKFSNHAIDRIRSRGISFKPEDMIKLNEAVDKAASKGSKNSLVLMNESAFIVSVKNRTVVTAMDQAALKENVFTNIDSTIVM